MPEKRTYHPIVETIVETNGEDIGRIKGVNSTGEEDMSLPYAMAAAEDAVRNDPTASLREIDDASEQVLDNAIEARIEEEVSRLKMSPEFAKTSRDVRLGAVVAQLAEIRKIARNQHSSYTLGTSDSSSSQPSKVSSVEVPQPITQNTVPIEMIPPKNRGGASLEKVEVVNGVVKINLANRYSYNKSPELRVLENAIENDGEVYVEKVPPIRVEIAQGGEEVAPTAANSYYSDGAAPNRVAKAGEVIIFNASGEAVSLMSREEFDTKVGDGEYAPEKDDEGHTVEGSYYPVRTTVFTKNPFGVPIQEGPLGYETEHGVDCYIYEEYGRIRFVSRDFVEKYYILLKPEPSE